MAAYLLALRTDADMAPYTDRVNLQQLQEIQQYAQANASIYLNIRAAQILKEKITNLADPLPASGWRLLASANSGDLDIEALGKIEAVWYHPRVAELIGSNMLPFARSAWQIQSAAAKMTNADMAKLAARTRELMAPVAAKMANFSGTTLNDLLACDYLLLAGMFTDAQRTELGKTGEDKLLTRALADPSKENLAALQGSLDKMGQRQFLDDNLMLTAQIANKQGGPLARALHEKLTDIVKGHPVNSNLLLLVNDLTK